MPLTIPLSVTVATLLFELFHKTSLQLPFTVAFSFRPSPAEIFADFLFNLIDFALLLLFTTHLLYTPLPSPEVHLITAQPLPFTVTTPFLFTVAIFLLDDCHFTILLSALVGVTFAFNVTFVPFLPVISVLFNLIF